MPSGGGNSSCRKLVQSQPQTVRETVSILSVLAQPWGMGGAGHQ